MDFVIFDLETTGLSPSQNEIIQIAGVRMRSGRILEGETFDTFVKPKARIPRFITGYTGISENHVKDAPDAPDALADFSRFVGDAVLIAHNGQRFDMPFIRETCARHRMPVRTVGFVDSISFSRRIWGGRGGHGLDEVMGRLQLSVHGALRHDARGDVSILAEAVCRMWKQITHDFGNCPIGLGSGVIPE